MYGSSNTNNDGYDGVDILLVSLSVCIRGLYLLDWFFGWW
jgi:hypothetical protein